MAPIGAVASQRPSVLFLLCDDIHWNAMGCAGNPHLKTSNIERLAQKGVRFPNAFCTNSLCFPSRASILTGLYARNQGVRANFTELPANHPHWPQRFREAGCHTAYLGKGRVGDENDMPQPRFDHFVTHKGQGKYCDTA